MGPRIFFLDRPKTNKTMTKTLMAPLWPIGSHAQDWKSGTLGLDVRWIPGPCTGSPKSLNQNIFREVFRPTPHLPQKTVCTRLASLFQGVDIFCCLTYDLCWNCVYCYILVESIHQFIRRMFQCRWNREHRCEHSYLLKPVITCPPNKDWAGGICIKHV